MVSNFHNNLMKKSCMPKYLNLFEQPMFNENSVFDPKTTLINLETAYLVMMSYDPKSNKPYLNFFSEQSLKSKMAAILLKKWLKLCYNFVILLDQNLTLMLMFF